MLRLLRYFMKSLEHSLYCLGLLVEKVLHMFILCVDYAGVIIVIMEFGMATSIPCEPFLKRLR